MVFWLSMVCSLLDTMQAEKNLNTRGDLVMSGLNPESLTKATASSSSSSLDDDENGRVQWFEQKLEILACTLLISIMSHYQQVSTLSLSFARSLARFRRPAPLLTSYVTLAVAPRCHRADLGATQVSVHDECVRRVLECRSDLMLT